VEGGEPVGHRSAVGLVYVACGEGGVAPVGVERGRIEPAKHHREVGPLAPGGDLCVDSSASRYDG